ncbi:MAG: hypothetical protein WKF37_15270 [Bryobacteraceae bacterium]
MMTDYYKAERAWELPPLILHPFSDIASPQKLVQSSRASLMLQGLLPNDEFEPEQLHEILLAGRYCEVRMLYYVGKDLVRWVEQCSRMVESEPELRTARIEWQSFSALLVGDPPAAVQEKLKTWGVADYKSIFARAMGLNAVFSDVPDRNLLTEDFIRNYHHFADQMFRCRQKAAEFVHIQSADFPFELFASGEYSRMLERQWQEN